MLSTGRQVQAEVTPMFFSSNTFMVLMRSLAKRSHHWHRSKVLHSFSEDAFASLRSFQLVNNFLCKTGRQRLPHCLHVDGVVVMVDRNSERAVALPPICSSGINLPGNNTPRPFAVADDNPCFLTCCAKSRKEAEEHLIREIEAAGLHFKHNKLRRGDVVGVAKECYQHG